MSAINPERMKKEFFEVWEQKVAGGLSPMEALQEIMTERPDLYGMYAATARTPLAESMKGGTADEQR